MKPLDHVECARAWAKCLAYRKAGNERAALEWWRKLEGMLGYVDHTQALEAIERLLDGSQPIDETGALFVARNALGRYDAIRGWDRIEASAPEGS